MGIGSQKIPIKSSKQNIKTTQSHGCILRVALMGATLGWDLQDAPVGDTCGKLSWVAPTGATNWWHLQEAPMGGTCGSNLRVVPAGNSHGCNLQVHHTGAPAVHPLNFFLYLQYHIQDPFI